MIVIWEAVDRICGKRLRAALPHLVESMERHGHLDLDPEVRTRLLTASAATLDQLLKPIRPTAGSRRRRRRRQSKGKRIPVQTCNDWDRPPPGFLEIDLVAHCGGPLSGSFIHSLVAADVCTGWTEAVPLLAKEQSLVVAGLEAVGQRLPFPSSVSTPTTTVCSSTKPWSSTVPTGASNSPVPGRTAAMTKRGLSRRTVPWSGASSVMTVTPAKSPDKPWPISTSRCVYT